MFLINLFTIFFNNHIFITSSLIIFSIIQSIFSGLVDDKFQDYISSDQRATLNSLNNFIFNIPFFILFNLFGIIATDSYQYATILFLSISIVFQLLFYFILKRFKL